MAGRCYGWHFGSPLHCLYRVGWLFSVPFVLEQSDCFHRNQIRGQENPCIASWFSKREMGIGRIGAYGTSPYGAASHDDNFLAQAFS